MICGGFHRIPMRLPPNVILFLVVLLSKLPNTMNSALTSEPDNGSGTFAKRPSDLEASFWFQLSRLTKNPADHVPFLVDVQSPESCFLSVAKKQPGT